MASNPNECVKFGVDMYSKHTPLKVRKIGNAITAFLTTISTITLVSNNPTIGLVIMLVNSAINQLVIPLWGIDDSCITPDGDLDIKPSTPPSNPPDPNATKSVNN